MTMPMVALNDGNEIPRIGFGAYRVVDDLTVPTLLTAFEIGYRSIDTASIYGNEVGIGRAIAESGLPRHELFVTTKLSVADMHAGRTRSALRSSLDRLSLESVDLYLLHWPAPATDAYLTAWEALEELRAEGLTRSIGVCNFGPDELRRIADLGGTTPAVNQIELHPALRNLEVERANAQHGIVTEAWGPLARGAVLGDPTIAAIARTHDRTAAQVVLRWHVQQDRVVIPKSSSVTRMRENFTIDGFTLLVDEMAAIDALDRGERIGPDPRTMNHD